MSLTLPVLTSSAIFSARRALLTWYGSSVTTIWRAPARALLDRGLRADLDRAATGRVGVLDPLLAHHEAGRREIGALDELHQVGRRGLGLVDGVDHRVDHLAEVVRRDVRGHSDRDAAGAVHEQVREPAGEHERLLLVAVVVRHHVDRLGLDVAEHLHRERAEARLGVAGRAGGVAVDRSEVAVRVDQGIAQREVLRHADHRVVDRRVAVRVVLAHHAADDVGRLAVGTVGPQALLEHRPQDPAVHRFQAVAHVGQGSADDHRHRVVEVGALDLLLELDGLDATGEQVLAHVWVPSVALTRPGSGRTGRSSR